MQHPRCITLNYRCFDSLYGQNGLSHDETKFLDRKFQGFLVLVNQASLQMATSNMTHCQYFHVIFHVLWLILAADITTVHGIAKTSYLVRMLLLKMVIILMIIQYKSQRSKLQLGKFSVLYRALLCLARILEKWVKHGHKPIVVWYLMPFAMYTDF